MTRPVSWTMPIVALVVVSLLGFSGLTPAQAATITDTFEVMLTGKQWCEGNPALSEPFKVNVDHKHPAQSTTLTITQDPGNTGDRTAIQATLNTQGASPELEAMILTGRAFPSNQTGRVEQVVLSGRNPGNPGHYLTLRGQATFTTTGHLLKLSGTYVFQTIGTYTTDKKTGAQSSPVDCFNSGTIVTTGKGLIIGILIDKPVDGLRYITSTNPIGGVTSGGGQYLCHVGETVTFFLGTHQLGAAQPCTAIITVAGLLGATSLTDPSVVNLAQLLMTLDSQINPDVLTIPNPLPAGVSPDQIPALTDPNFDTTVLAALPNGTVLVTGDAAVAQLQLSLKQLTVTGAANVTVTSSPMGINCVNGSGTCALFFPTGTVVTLTATGPGFIGWNGGGCTGLDPCVVTLAVDTTVKVSSPNYTFFLPQLGGSLMAVNPASPTSTPVTVNDFVSFSTPAYAAGGWDFPTWTFNGIQRPYEIYASGGKLWRVSTALSSGAPGSGSNPPTQVSNETAVSGRISVIDDMTPLDSHWVLYNSVEGIKLTTLGTASGTSPITLTGVAGISSNFATVYKWLTGVATHVLLQGADLPLAVLDLETKSVKQVPATVEDDFVVVAQDTSDRVFILSGTARPNNVLYLYTISTNTLVSLVSATYASRLVLPGSPSDGNNLYVANNGLVYKIPLSATAPSDVVTLLDLETNRINHLLTTDNRVYVMSNSNQLISVAKAGGLSRVEASFGPFDFAVMLSHSRAGLVYFTQMTVDPFQTPIQIAKADVHVVDENNNAVATYSDNILVGAVFSSTRSMRSKMAEPSRILMMGFSNGSYAGGLLRTLKPTSGVVDLTLGGLPANSPTLSTMPGLGLIFLNYLDEAALGLGFVDMVNHTVYSVNPAIENSLGQVPVPLHWWVLTSFSSTFWKLVQ